MSLFSRTSSKTWLAPEVIQSSAMDCGPASLKCLLEGFHRPISYGRLREACQTDVDGTSIDTMEEVACQLGLEAEQVVIPLDHLAFSLSRYPCIIVTILPNGLTHFVVLWSKLGRYVQVMDPATGRHWVPWSQLVDKIFIHTTPVPAEAWREWVESDDFMEPLVARFQALSIPSRRRRDLLGLALSDPGWGSMAALDAALRMTQEIVDSGALSSGREAVALLSTLYEQGREQGIPAFIEGQGSADDATDDAEALVIPRQYWSVLAMEPDEDGDAQLGLTGCVLARVTGTMPLGADGLPIAAPHDDDDDEDEAPEPLSPELQAALQEETVSPQRQVWSMIRQDGLLMPMVLVFALFATTLALLVEALVLRGFLEIGAALSPPEQRLTAAILLVALGAILLMLSIPTQMGILRIGRHLELRLRLAFLEKIPRLNDRYFQSRLTSDMADRSHSISDIRRLPMLALNWISCQFELVLTCGALLWLSPTNGWVLIVGVVLLIVATYAFQSLLVESDLRLRTHAGALTKFYLDALHGLIPIRAHRADRPIRREHEALQLEWYRAGKTLLSRSLMIDFALFLLGYGLVGVILWRHVGGGGEAASLLLLVYWALKLPALSQRAAMMARSYPSMRNIALRLLEPLGAPESPSPSESLVRSAEQEAVVGVSLRLTQVDLRIAGHDILHGLDLNVAPGEHVAIVGSSGAGKSSLVGLFLGWHRPATGQLLIDGEPFESEHIELLRRETAWVDPQIQIWNRSMLQNLYYGLAPEAFHPPHAALQDADLRSVVEALPDGLQSLLGEDGCLLSGGQGQRVRFGRALMHPSPRLVVMDEPFRGLDRHKRRLLLERARERWERSTLLYISHDIQTTQAFHRVLVIEDGAIVEDDAPAALMATESRYRQLSMAEHATQTGMWQSAIWRRLTLADGVLQETPSTPVMTSPEPAGPGAITEEWT